MNSNTTDESADGLIYRQLYVSQFRQDIIQDFAIRNEGNNFVLNGMPTELYTYELFANERYASKFPYLVSTIEISKEMPLNSFIDDVDLPAIYARSTLAESQALSLEPVYVGKFSREPVESRLLLASFAPQPLPDNSNLLAILTNYGAFALYRKETDGTKWTTHLSLNSIINEAIVPAYEGNRKEIRSFNEFQNYFDRYWVKTFCWQYNESSNQYILWGSTAGSYVFSMTLARDALSLVGHTCQKVENMERICYLNAVDCLLLISDAFGVVRLYNINSSGLNSSAMLWSRADRMGLQQAFINNCNDEENRYILAFTKAAHFFAFSVSSSGEVIGHTRHYIGGIKITGIASLKSNEFLAATFDGEIHHIRVNNSKNYNELWISVQIVNTKLNLENHQITGMVISRHKCIITLLISRTAEVLPHCYRHRNVSMLNFGQLVDFPNPLKELISTHFDELTPYSDYLLAIRLEIRNDLNLEKYFKIWKEQQAKFAYADLLSDDFQRELQISLMCHETIFRTHNKTTTKAELPNQNEFEFLQIAVEVSYIIRCLSYMDTCEMLSPFQARTAAAMLARLQQVVNKVLQWESEHCAAFKKNTLAFVECVNGIISSLNKVGRIGAKCKQTCPYCAKPTDFANNCTACKALLKYCVLSYQSITYDASGHFCAECGRRTIIDKRKFLELSSPTRRNITCPFCRTNFVTENIYESFEQKLDSLKYESIFRDLTNVSKEITRDTKPIDIINNLQLLHAS